MLGGAFLGFDISFIGGAVELRWKVDVESVRGFFYM